VSPVPTLVLRQATLRDGRRCDVVISGALVVDVVPAGTGVAEKVVDLAGRLLLPAAAEPHAHLDKAYTWDTIDPPMGDLEAAIVAFHSHQELLESDDTYARAKHAALRLAANGTTAIRSHVNILPGDRPFRGVDAMVRLRNELAGTIHLELVALPPVDMDDAAIGAALDRGLDLVGGAPHLAEDPIADVRRLLAIAAKRGIGADLHTDESLTGPLTITEFARVVMDWPDDRIRTAGHCVRLGTLSEDELAPVIEAIVAAKLGIISLPITNLYLQGWDHPVSMPRGLTALRPLIDAGAMVSGGADNVRDPFNPLGRSDAFETAALLVTAGHTTLEEAWHLVSNGAREVMGLPVADAVPGAAADFLAVDAASLGQAIAEAPADRIVIHAGRVIARSTVTQELFLSSTTDTTGRIDHG